jgi:ATP-binding cassette subfamily B protein
VEAIRKYSDFTLYKRLLSIARPYWPHILGVFALSLLSVPLGLLSPLPLKIAVDSVIGSRPLPSFLEVLLPLAATVSGAGGLLLAVALLVATALLSRLLDLASSLLRSYTAEKLVLSFRAQLFRHVQRLSLSYHDSKGTSDSTYRIQHDAPSIEYIALDGVIPFITAGCTLISMLYITARLDGQLMLIALAVSPAFYFITRSRRRTLRGYSREVKKLESSALSVVQEVLGAVRVVKAFGQEDREHSRFVRRSDEGLRKRIRLAGIEGGYSLLVGLTTAIGTGAVLYVGVRHVQAGTLSIGNLLLVMAYLTRLYEPLRNIGRKAASLQTYLAGAERAFSLLDEAPDVPERPDARPLSRASGSVAFDHVSFAYEEERLVLHQLSFQIPPGSRVGFAGKTGVGKTTLVNLLTRFYDPTSGRILLDGVDLRDYKLADLRNQFAMVLQEPVLFSSSIAENIAYARPGAEFAEIVAAAKAANAHEFIIGLPKGYDTLVGERGMRLSGGERQRISLARAFLKDAPILILDEPTSSVDVNTEAVIIEAMARLMHRRTTFLITHRLSSLKHCDLLLVLEDGRVATRTNVSATVREALADGGLELEAVIRGDKAGA